MKINKEELKSDIKYIAILFCALFIIGFLFNNIPNFFTFLATMGDDKEQIEIAEEDLQDDSEDENNGNTEETVEESDSYYAALMELPEKDAKDFYNFPTTLYYQSDAEWLDKGEYYELSEQCVLSCYDYIDISRFQSAKDGDYIRSNGDNEFYKTQPREEFAAYDGYIGELKDSVYQYELYDMGNGLASINSNDYGKSVLGSAGSSRTSIRIRKDAVVNERYIEETETASSFAENTKSAFEQEAVDSGFEVVYYPVFDKDGFVTHLEYASTTPSLGY